jgi:hypothetical protein
MGSLTVKRPLSDTLALSLPLPMLDALPWTRKAMSGPAGAGGAWQTPVGTSPACTTTASNSSWTALATAPSTTRVTSSVAPDTSPP